MDFLSLQGCLLNASPLATGFDPGPRPEPRCGSAFLDSSEDAKSWPAHLPLSVAATSNIFRCAGAARVE